MLPQPPAVQVSVISSGQLSTVDTDVNAVMQINLTYKQLTSKMMYMWILTVPLEFFICHQDSNTHAHAVYACANKHAQKIIICDNKWQV